VGDYITSKFSDSEITALRRAVTVGLLPHVPELYRRKHLLYSRLVRLATPVPVTSRFITLLLTVLTVYEFLGGDPEAMYLTIVDKYRSRLDAINSQDYQSEVINAALYTEAIKATLDARDNLNGYVTARSLIIDGDHARLNSSECGVYLLPEKGWIVIVWRQARFSVLSRSPYRTHDEATLREGVAKNAFVVHDISDEDHQYIRTALHLTDVKNPSGYTVLDSAYLLSDEAKEKMRKPRKRRPEEEEPAREDAAGSEFVL
jgi:hypothetical protein